MGYESGDTPVERLTPPPGREKADPWVAARRAMGMEP